MPALSSAAPYSSSRRKSAATMEPRWPPRLAASSSSRSLLGAALTRRILPAKAPGVALLPGQLGDVLGDLDAGALVEAARMGGDDVRAVEDADLVQRRHDDESVPRVGMGDAIVVAVEPGVRRLADDDLDPFVGGEAVAGQAP